MLEGSLWATRHALWEEEQRKAEETEALDATRHRLDADEEEAFATRHAKGRRALRKPEAAGSRDDAVQAQGGTARSRANK